MSPPQLLTKNPFEQMKKQPTFFTYSVRILLERAGRLLLLQRVDTKGGYSLPGGKIEKGESPKQAIKRETLEEIGLRIKKKHLHLVHTLQKNRKTNPDEIIYFFSCTKWDGKLEILEPHKFKAIRWVDKGTLPENLSGVFSMGIKAIQQGGQVSYYSKQKVL